MMTMKTVSVAKDFTRFPSGRHKSKGATSGEGFREIFLEPELREGQEVEVDLDGTIGYGSSFLEEAFGGIVRSLGITAEDLNRLLHIKSEDPALVEEVRGYIFDAQKKKIIERG
jgi:hypothetical protein